MAIQTITADIDGQSSVAIFPAVIRGSWSASIAAVSSLTATLGVSRFGIYAVALTDEQNYIFPQRRKAYDAIFVKEFPLVL